MREYLVGNDAVFNGVNQQSATESSVESWTPFEVTLNSSGVGTFAIADADKRGVVGLTPQGNFATQGSPFRDDLSNTTQIVVAMDAFDPADAGKKVKGLYGPAV